MNLQGTALRNSLRPPTPVWGDMVQPSGRRNIQVLERHTPRELPKIPCLVQYDPAYLRNVRDKQKQEARLKRRRRFDETRRRNEWMEFEKKQLTLFRLYQARKKPAPLQKKVYSPEEFLLQREHATMAEVSAWVANETGMSLEDLRSTTRANANAWARHMFWWICKRDCKASIAASARYLGRDHTTALHGIKRHEERISKGLVAYTPNNWRNRLYGEE